MVLQHIAAVRQFSEELEVTYGRHAEAIKHVMIAYRPRLERIPHEACDSEMLQSVVTLNKDGEFLVGPWQARPAGRSRCQVQQVDVALFAYRSASLPSIVLDGQDHQPELRCLCCNQTPFSLDRTTEENPPSDNLEVLYEETDWVELNMHPLPEEVRVKLQNAISSLRRMQAQLVLTRVLEEPDRVRQELREWLGDQADAIDRCPQFVEVFTGKAPLASKVQSKPGRPNWFAIWLRLEQFK